MTIEKTQRHSRSRSIRQSYFAENHTEVAVDYLATLADREVGGNETGSFIKPPFPPSTRNITLPR